MAEVALRSGPCTPWCTNLQIEKLPTVQRALKAAEKNGGVVPSGAELKELAEEAAAAASDLLYELSGRQFSGSCGPVTIRPVSRPSDVDTKSWGARLSPLGWYSSIGAYSAYGSYGPGVMAHYGTSAPPEIELGAYPVTEVTKVLIDGVEIPEAEWELRDHRWLVRIRPTASSVPTERYGWPTSQIMDVPDTQPGTFSITYKYGTPPPTAGVRAAKKLAEYLLLPSLGDTTRYPTRVTHMSRQGVSATVTDVMDVIKSGSLGIYEVDAFILAHNPKKLARQSLAWSPDIGRPRRQSRVG